MIKEKGYGELAQSKPRERRGKRGEGLEREEGSEKNNQYGTNRGEGKETIK